MKPTTGREPRRRRWTTALLLAAVALIALVVVSPAIAKPTHAAHVSGASLSAPGIIAVAVIAVFGAVVLLLFALLSTRRDRAAAGPAVQAPARLRRTRGHRRSIAA
jgi:uncharacterized membrane protein YhaH (DUF805 family)